MEEKNTNYMELSCQDFMEQLAGPGAVPGGGGAAALSGALGMGLMSMVASLTIGKKKYAAVEAEVKQLHNRAESLRLALMQGVDKDAEVFAPLAQAYRLPDGTPEELAAKARVLLRPAKIQYILVPRLAAFPALYLQRPVRMFPVKGRVW